MRHWAALPRLGSPVPRCWRGSARSIRSQYLAAKPLLMSPGRFQPSAASRPSLRESVLDTRSLTSSPYTANTLRIGNEHLLHQIPEMTLAHPNYRIQRQIREKEGSQDLNFISTSTCKIYAPGM